VASDDSVSASGTVPVFPLPGTVFFPQTVLPLHVFEPRYRALVRDASAGEGLIAISLLRPGWERDYAGSPEYEPLGTVGRIEDLSPLPDGRFLLRLIGVQRVDFLEVVRDDPYRVVRIRPRVETRLDEDDPAVRERKLALLASHACLLGELGDDQDRIVLDERVPLESAVNGICASLPIEPARRQDLLAEDDLASRMVLAGELLDAVLEQVLKLKSVARDDSREAN
jgi:Lon protease-like protein